MLGRPLSEERENGILGPSSRHVAEEPFAQGTVLVSDKTLMQQGMDQEINLLPPSSSEPLR